MKDLISQFFTDIFLRENQDTTPLFRDIHKDLIISYQKQLYPCYLDAAFVSVDYDTHFRKHFINFKYYRNTQHLEKFVNYLDKTFQLVSQKYSTDIITSVPNGLISRFTRGHNQSYVLAQALAQKNQIPFLPLFSTTWTKQSQAQALSREDRKSNSKHSFQFLKNIPSLVGKKVVLVDDIISTGSTANEIARQLKEK